MRAVHVLCVLVLAVPAIHTAGESPAEKNPHLATLERSLQPFTARYAMSMKGQPWATAVIDLRRARVGGKPAFRHSFSLYFKDQTVYDETLFLQDSFRPIMKFIHGGLPPEIAYKVYTYQENGIRGSNVFEDGREPVPLQASFEGRVFGAGTATLILSALPLKEGWSTTLDMADDEGLHPDTVRVESRETVRAGGQTYQAWVVSMLEGKGRQWIAEHPPYLIKQDFPEAGITWELSDLLRDRDWMETHPATP